MTPVKASLKYPVVTLVLTFMAVAVGVHAFLTMPRTEDPSITVRAWLVLAAYPGATSEQVEEQVTRTLEEHIFKFPEVRKQKTFSTSRPGLVIINVELESNVTNSDIFWSKLRHELNETAAMHLPAGVRGPIVNSDFGDTVAMLIAIHGKRYGYRELREIEEVVKAGNALEVGILGARTSLLQSRQSLMTAEDQVSDLTAELDNLLGLPDDTEALALRKESERLAGNQLKEEVISEAKFMAAVAATRKAEVDELQARLACELARAEITRITGARAP